MIHSGLHQFLPRNLLQYAAGPAVGEIIQKSNADGTTYLAVRVQNFTASALTKNQPYVVRYNGAVSGNLTVAACTTAVTGVLQNLGFGAYVTTTCSGQFSESVVVVADEAIATSGAGFVAIWGYHDCLVDGSGTSIAVGDSLRVAPSSSSTALIQDVGVSGIGPFTRPPRSCALANAAASAAATTIRVFLYGEPCIISP